MYINKERLYGNLKSKFILIEDSVGVNGLKILKTVIKLYLKENVDVLIMYYELLKGELLIKNADESNIVEFSAVSVPHSWSSHDEFDVNLRSLDIFMKQVSGFKGVICLDSLSPLIFHSDIQRVYRVLHKILKENPDLHLVAVLHTDIHGSCENEILEKLASTVLFVSPNDDKLLTTVHYSSGKVSKQLVEFKISEEFEFTFLRDVNPQVKSAPIKQPDPTANLTFNLKLKDNEKEARSQLKLPYMQIEKSDVTEVENDMYDEEDPDDDLDI